nr:MAG TPA: hypothetical protein [Caudoviricetes sp.]DAV19417.1 MAG TPA: hypothetical protein [Bacteriophage sp.]
MDCKFSCNKCIQCENSKVKKHGKSLCYNSNGKINCDYYYFCQNMSSDVIACMNFIPKK